MAVVRYTDDTKQRLDVFLASRYPLLTRSYIAKQIAAGLIKVNSKIAKASLRLIPGDSISFTSLALKTPKFENINLPIIYEDDFCIVINKPSGIITHPKGSAYLEGSIASFIAPKLKFDTLTNRSGIVHRLDRGTSGVIIAAKNEFATKYLQRQFAKRQVSKTYLAITSGKLDQPSAHINMPIERNPKHPSTFRVGVNGKPAITNYQVIAFNNNHSLLRLQPQTGRTHQLRVHLQAIHHPIMGDSFYGGEPADRLMLHAYSLEVTLPDIGRKLFTAPIPEEFREFFKDLPEDLWLNR